MTRCLDHGKKLLAKLADGRQEILCGITDFRAA